MAKVRTDIPAEIAASVLFESNRTCCVCRKAKPVQIHHIDENPANHLAENLAVLCFDCHRDTQIHGGFDRKLDRHQIALYREDWMATVARERGKSSDLSLPLKQLPESITNVRPIRPWHTRIRFGARNVAVEDRAGPLAALIAPFRNDPSVQRPHVGAASQLVATITLDASPDFTMTGHWLGSSSPYVRLAPGEQQLLVVAAISPTTASILSDVRRDKSGEVELKHFLLAPTTVTETELSVTCSAEGKLLCIQRYHIKVWPFPDIQFD